MRDAVQKIRRAVEWVDDPAMPRIRPRRLAALLEEQPIARARPRQLCPQGATALRSAVETNSPGPLTDTCNCSTSPKSRIRPRAALSAAFAMTFRTGDRMTIGSFSPSPADGSCRGVGR
jgi:hypothetical protein